MQISLKWINELVNIKDINLDILIEKLTLGGFEVEEIIELERNGEKQIALDISSTANRSDSLSIQGLSTEITALLNQSSTNSPYSRNFEDLKQTILKESKILSQTEDCSMLSSVVIENLTNSNVPKWITKKLLDSGITPVNNLLDFQNYILLETGYPFSFYDFEKIKAKSNNSIFKLAISNAKNKQKFIATNEITYELDDSILLIQTNNIPLSIAGIIENQEFSYSPNTSSLLIEGSIFNAAKIRQQSRRLGLRTDRSSRYEKSLKNNYLIESFYRLISLLRITNPNLTCKFQTLAKTIDPIFEPISLRYKRVCEILGPILESNTEQIEYIPPIIIESYLERLNFKSTYDSSNQCWEVIIPSSRIDDITREIDLIEEIGRLHGFNNFLITLPKLNTVGIEDESYQTRKKITSCLLNLGFNELIHYSLVNEKTFLKNEIKLINPLTSEYSNLRKSLLPNLIKTVQENLKQGNNIINGFEYGHIFCSTNNQKITEQEHVAGIFGGFKTKLTWSDSEIPITWFEAKGKMEQLLNQLNIDVNWKNTHNHLTADLCHPYRTAEIVLFDQTPIGIFGQINPLLANQLNLPLEIYIFELNLETIKTQLRSNNLMKYKEYSSYPKIVKDISFIIQRDISFNEIQKLLYYNGTKFLSEIQLLDEYNGKNIPPGHTSLCLQLVFQSDEKTLQTKQVEEILTNIRKLLTQNFKAIIRE